MALKPLQATMPLGQFDGNDSNFLNLKGGEVVTFKPVSIAGSDKAAKDVFDGYAVPASPVRPYVTLLTATTDRPLMLADEGISGYGTLFGTVVGGTVGQISTGGAVLGPHTATGSGKVTCWAQPGLYAVSLDAVASDLQPTQSITVGAGVYGTTSTGLLAASNSGTVRVGTFVEFVTNGSLVNTPNYLVAALNSPSGEVSSVQARSFAYAVIYFDPALAATT